MFLLGFRRKLTALALCKSIESAIQWFQIHHRITFATIHNPAVYLSGARVSIFSTLVPRLIGVSYTVFTILIASVLTLKAFSRYIARFFSCFDFVEVSKIVSLYILGLV